MSLTPRAGFSILVVAMLDQQKFTRAVVLPVMMLTASVSSATEHFAGTWVSFVTSGSWQSEGRNNRWGYWLDAQARYVDIGSGANQLVVRPAVGYRLNDNVTTWLGYARLETRSRGGASAFENRYWQQIDWTAARWGETSMSMRLRLEQRTLSTGNDIGLTLRYRVRLSRPFGQSADHRIQVSLEPFLDFRDTDWRGSAGLHQNRLFVGASFAFAGHWRFETGYMNQYLGFDGREDVSNHLYIARFALLPR